MISVIEAVWRFTKAEVGANSGRVQRFFLKFLGQMLFLFTLVQHSITTQGIRKALTRWTGEKRKQNASAGFQKPCRGQYRLWLS